MANSPTYPGVYIEEVPSGVHTIQGVATSITAFIGRSERGPIDTPLSVYGFPEFEQVFGGLWEGSPAPYAVWHFFQNGGKHAIFVRVYPEADEHTAKLDVKGLKLEAISPGAWGNKLRARVEHVAAIEHDHLERGGAEASELFHLTIHDIGTGETESLRSVSVADGPSRVDQALAQGSRLVRVRKKCLPSRVPSAHASLEDHPTAVDWENDELSTGVSKLVAAKGDAPLGSPHDLIGDRKRKTGIYALEDADLFNLMCIPPDARVATTDVAIYDAALSYCVERRAMLIVDSPATWAKSDDVIEAFDNVSGDKAQGSVFEIGDSRARNAALYFPRVIASDSLGENGLGTFVPCGMIAGVMAHTDTTRGVWKAPANVHLSAVGLSVRLNNDENGELNGRGINCLRIFSGRGTVVWGARTMRGTDRMADEYKYVPVRRLALFIEESVSRGTSWVVFEPNDEPLWAQVRRSVSEFMMSLFREDAFAGATPEEAYLVRCDAETTTEADRELGFVNIVVGFAPLKPAEFVVIKIVQAAGREPAG